MKKVIGFILSALGLFAPLLVVAQGTLYFSNLGQTSAGSAVVASDSWIAQGFGTGTNAAGYTVNSVQLLMGEASGNPNGFNISIYSKSGNSPQNNLGSLVGSDPAANGVYTYTASGLILSPSTAYYVVVTAATSVAQGAYSWSATSGNNPSIRNDGWLGGIYDFSTDGSNWNYSRDQFFQFSITGTAVPEPSTAVLAGLGLVGLSFWRCKRSQKVAHSCP
jgi:hypothetical protein